MRYLPLIPILLWSSTFTPVLSLPKCESSPSAGPDYACVTHCFEPNDKDLPVNRTQFDKATRYFCDTLPSTPLPIRETIRANPDDDKDGSVYNDQKQHRDVFEFEIGVRDGCDKGDDDTKKNCDAMMHKAMSHCEYIWAWESNECTANSI